ncbi:MAG TPA: hypothetical protein VLG92_04065 [Candidatus Saccharimonadia bacterium]|nr:hypothetical protein [Candidatus Saccharimonadia bacterium]
MKRLDQSGSHILAFALLILVLGVVGFTGYKVQQSHDKTDVADSSVTSTQTTVPKAVTTTADLQAAGQVLDQSSAQLSNSLDDGQLNADLNSML